MLIFSVMRTRRLKIPVEALIIDTRDKVEKSP